VKFGKHVRNSIPHIFIIGIFKLIFGDGETLIAGRQWNESFNLLSFSLTLGNPSRATRGKT